MKLANILLAVAFCLGTSAILSGQIQSGPMLGYNNMREVMLWVQTSEASRVYFEYWESESDTRHRTATIRTQKQDAFIAQCIADEVLPGRQYDYTVFIDGKRMEFDYPLTFKTQALWHWRSEPPAFKFAFGSCLYVNEERFDRPGKLYGKNYGILNSIYQQQPDFMIWGGDNTYLREADWNTGTGILHRYTHTRSLPELQPLLANTHHYATWDDHDFGPNNSDRSWWNKRAVLRAFKLFWGNAHYIFENEGVTSTFVWNDCQFFIMDDRWWRSPNDRKQTGERIYWGEQQMQWLIDALTYSQATFKFVVNGGQIVNPAQVFENMSNYKKSREQLLRLLEDEKISGVIFLTGDRHHTCLQKLDRIGTYPLYDLTISPLTSGAGSPVAEEDIAPFVENTLITEQQNFSVLEVSGPRKDRVLTIKVFDAGGNILWTEMIKAADLR